MYRKEDSGTIKNLWCYKIDTTRGWVSSLDSSRKRLSEKGRQEGKEIVRGMQGDAREDAASLPTNDSQDEAQDEDIDQPAPSVLEMIGSENDFAIADIAEHRRIWPLYIRLQSPEDTPGYCICDWEYI